ncbi:hypothetical protein TRFO_43168 [Tritrichomonas foetus]|uniref:Initiator binding domain-containing protein n=1 Tax=Tritrichomonas foetus TaxID=1144522 RepID=A0A1J4KRZ7_9EUKA|nr:hypothetical protein TRFO_43168 [Tritrichomonas foetus]|eukprot:OHT14047.1 hypothetical protein TRFO_43168 [Tritrichomonas foetus]
MFDEFDDLDEFCFDFLIRQDESSAQTSSSKSTNMHPIQNQDAILNQTNNSNVNTDRINATPATVDDTKIINNNNFTMSAASNHTVNFTNSCNLMQHEMKPINDNLDKPNKMMMVNQFKPTEIPNNSIPHGNPNMSTNVIRPINPHSNSNVIVGINSMHSYNNLTLHNLTCLNSFHTIHSSNSMSNLNSLSNTPNGASNINNVNNIPGNPNNIPTSSNNSPTKIKVKDQASKKSRSKQNKAGQGLSQQNPQTHPYFAESFESLSLYNICVNPLIFKFLPPGQWEDRHMCVSTLLKTHFQSLSTKKIRFEHKLWNALQLTSAFPELYQILGLSIVTPSLLKADRDKMGNSFALTKPNAALFNQQGAFPSHGFVEVTREDALRKFRAHQYMITDVDEMKVRLYAPKDNNMTLNDHLQNCHWNSPTQNNV